MSNNLKYKLKQVARRKVKCKNLRKLKTVAKINRRYAQSTIKKIPKILNFIGKAKQNIFKAKFQQFKHQDKGE